MRRMVLNNKRNEGVEKPESDHPIQTGQSFFCPPKRVTDFFTAANFLLPHNDLNAA